MQIQIQGARSFLWRGLCFWLTAAACIAQTSPTAGATLPHRVLIQQKDYETLRIQSNNLSALDLPALQDKARAGDMSAQLRMGMAYQLGCPGATHDPTEALK